MVPTAGAAAVASRVGEADPRFLLAGRLVVLAGGIARAHRSERRDDGPKADRSTVPAVDLEIEQRIARDIRSLFSEDAVVGQETGVLEGQGLDARYWWMVDPVDGTGNFGLGLPGFAVSIGVLRDGRPFAGAVYDPIANWLFTACVGAGAWLNGRRLALPPTPLSSRSLFAVRAPYAAGVPVALREWLPRYSLRRFGSTALELCYVAAGGLALVHDHEASLWDIAGAAAVLVEAGGVLTRVDGTSIFPVVREDVGERIACLAGDPVAHRAALAEVAAGEGA
jgi:myo-inositol-1(or 4)-monophosphatase